MVICSEIRARSGLELPGKAAACASSHHSQHEASSHPGRFLNRRLLLPPSSDRLQKKIYSSVSRSLIAERTRSRARDVVPDFRCIPCLIPPSSQSKKKGARRSIDRCVLARVACPQANTPSLLPPRRPSSLCRSVILKPLTFLRLFACLVGLSLAAVCVSSCRDYHASTTVDWLSLPATTHLGRHPLLISNYFPPSSSILLIS